MAKCNNCKFITEEILISIYDGRKERCKCSVTNEEIQKDKNHNCKFYESVKNADRIRNMTDDELSMIIMCPYDSSEDDCVRGTASCLNCCLEWLQSPAEV